MIRKKDFPKFHSELKQVMKYIKYSADKKEFKKSVEDDKDFEEISKETADLITAMTGYDIEIKENEGGKVNMCEAIRGIREEAWTEGKKEGKKEGKAEGRVEGIAEGKVEGKFELLVELIRKGILTEKVAAENSDMTLEEFKVKVANYKKANIK